MDMFTFSDLPISRGKNLGVAQGEEVGADFFIKVETDDLPMEKMKKMTLKQGQAEFHDAYILHHSPENNSDRSVCISHNNIMIHISPARRRCAWIVRYIPDYVSIPKGSWRKMYQDDYPLVRLN